MSTARIEFVRRLFEAAERGGPRAGVALLPEDISWRLFGGGGRVLHSRAELERFYEEMESAGEARRTGARAGTRWFAITDEDKIQARAAELARRTKRAGSKRQPAKNT